MGLDQAIKVLLVEENEDHGILINNVFRKYGDKYQLITVQSLKDAMKEALNSDIIVTNLSLPDGSGIEFLKNHDIYENIPVVILESFVEQEMVVKLIKSGVFDYINKSNEAFETLPEKIDKYLELRNLRIERKRISEQQNKLSTAIKHSSESIIITDTNGIIEFVNPAFETATGYKSEEVLGKNPSVLKSNQHDKKFYENLWRTILSGKSWKGHFINKKKDGTFFEEEASVSPVFDNNGEIINFVALQRDVSDMIKIENQLRHAQKMEGIGTLAAGIAHEINTPLQYLYDNTLFIKDSFQVILDSISQVKALAGIYSNDKKTDNDNNFAAMKDILTKDNLEYLTDEIPKAIEENINGLKIVRKIVLAMKDFSHPGLQTMQKADINDAISSTVIITKNVWKFHAEVVTEFEETLPEVTCHIGDINQVFLNMITNSCDAIVEKNGCDAKGVIRIKTRSDENFVYVTIQDTGSGIPQKIIDKIFHPFFTTKDVGKGTGQGLALSYDIITNKHNGEIIVESEIGVGTKFVIKLPIEYKE